MSSVIKGSLPLLVFLSAWCTCGAYNDRPVIGILAQATDPDSKPFYGDTSIPSTYVIYLQSAGARVVPIMVNKPEEYYQYMFKSLNGVLFPGGSVSLSTSGYAKAATKFYNMALQANDAGDYFPIWGTCLGFEMLMTLTADKNPITDVHLMDKAVPLAFNTGFKKSRLFQNLPDDVLSFLATKNVTENFHMYGVTKKTFKEDNNLSKFYRLLSTNVDDKGLEFVSTVEGKNYPVYAVQWHPEKPMATWNLNLHVTHSPEAVRVAQYMANFFVSEARKSNHKFATVTEELDASIENFTPIFHKDASFNNYYYFNYSTSEPVPTVLFNGQ